mmetsp:Transcript_23710/g.32653  ORF Transcript_23710/g.32653 Transcript_23710/m.32653 type:complete len:179 (-) Transcript_23710:297-833(-)
MLTFKLLYEMIHHTVIEIFATQVSVSCCCFHFEDSLFDGQKRYIESTSTKIKNQYVSLSSCILFVKTVGNGCSSRLVDDAQTVKTRDSSSIFGGLTLRIVEVSRDCHHSVLHLFRQICLCYLFHFNEDHGRNLFCRKDFLLTFVVNLNHRFFGFTRNHFKRPKFKVGLHTGVTILATD